MAAGYVIAQLKVKNPENYKEYVAKVSEVVKKYDGEYLMVKIAHNLVNHNCFQLPNQILKVK